MSCVPLAERRWFGAALLPQAGVAVGMALVAAREFPDAGEMIQMAAIAVNARAAPPTRIHRSGA